MSRMTIPAAGRFTPAALALALSILGATAAVAMVGDTLTDVAHLPVQSWRDAARALPGIGAVSHPASSTPFGPVLFARGGVPATLDVTLDGLPLADPWTGATTFEMPLDALESIALDDDGTLRLATRTLARPGVSIGGRVRSENAVGGANAVARPGRERYEFFARGRRGAERATLWFTAAGQLRQFGDRDPRRSTSPEWSGVDSALGVPAGADRRQPGNGLEGASGWATIGARVPRTGWSAELTGLASRDDWRESLRWYVFDLAHAPRAVSHLAEGSLALTHEGIVKLRLRATHANSSFSRGDGVTFENVPALVDSVGRGNPLFPLETPYFYLPGHFFTSVERWRGTRTILSGEMEWSPGPHHVAIIRAEMGRETARHLSVVGAAIDPASDAVGYDALGREIGGSAWKPRSAAFEVGDTYSTGSGSVRAGLGVVQLESRNTDPLFAVPDTLFGIPGTVGFTPGFRRRTFFTPRITFRLEADARTFVHATARRTIRGPSLADRVTIVNAFPERATEIAAGAEHMLAHGTRVGATAWFRGLDPVTAAPSGSQHDGDATGVDLVAEQDASSHRVRMSWTVSSSRQRFQAGNSRNIAWTGGSAPIVRAPSPDDRRHRLTVDAGWWSRSTPEVPAWRRGWRLDGRVRAESGAPYTPTEVYNEVTLAAVSTQPAGGVNSARTPWASSLDAALSRSIAGAGLEGEITLQVFNVFDARNVADVYTSTGSADETNWLLTEDGQTYLAATGARGRTVYEYAQHDPAHWHAPRAITLSLRIGF